MASEHDMHSGEEGKAAIKVPCPYCGARNEDPRPWGGNSLVCPACEDRLLDHDAALSKLEA